MQKKGIGALVGLLGILIIVIFSVCMASYVHLGPDDQVLLKRATGKYTVNGPWEGQLHPFHTKEFRKAKLLDPLQYAIVADMQTAIHRVVEGPKLMFLGPHDEVKSTHQKIVLEVHEYIRLTDRLNGTERVLQGPATLVPRATEIHSGPEKALFLNVGQAVVRRDKMTGVQTLMTGCKGGESSGLFVPAAMEEIVHVRDLIHVLPHQALVVRDVRGKMTVFSGKEEQNDQNSECKTTSGGGKGGTAFFLEPHSKIVRMSWSVFPNPSEVGPRRNAALEEAEEKERRLEEERASAVGRRLESIYVDVASTSKNEGPRRTVTAIDMRTTKSFYQYEVRTSDNVRMLLEGTIFWQITDVDKMLEMTSDPEGDVWSKCRSFLIGEVGTVNLDRFMKEFNEVVQNAFSKYKQDVFFAKRGVTLISMELTNYRPVDEYTANTLQSIIRQTVQRINDLEKQNSENDVQKEKLDADLLLEGNRTELITAQADNAKLLAKTQGATKGEKSAESVNSYIAAMPIELDTTIDASRKLSRLDLFTQQKKMDSARRDTKTLSQGSASLYMAPKDMELRLQMPSRGSEL